MKQESRAIKYILFPVIILALMQVSCTTTSYKDRGSLSDAMDKARDDHQGDRSVPNNPRNPEEHDIWEDDQDAYWEEEEDADYERRDKASIGTATIWGGMRGGNALGTDCDIETDGDLDGLLGLSFSGGSELYLFGGLKGSHAEPGSGLDGSVKDSIIFLRGGLEFRITPFPEWVLCMPYVAGGLGGFSMSWTFRNPLSAGNDIITDDFLGGLLLYAGLGVQVVKTEWFSLGLNLIQDFYLFSDVTDEGFDNDLFDQYITPRWMVEVLFQL